MRWDIVAFFGIATALVLGTMLAVFVSTIFFKSDESKLINPDGSLATKYPTLSPTNLPSLEPTNSPSDQPSPFPTSWPSMSPTESTRPTSSPSSSPSSLPSMQPTLSTMPSASPSLSPTISSKPSTNPSMSPSMSSQPSSTPSSQPTSMPSSQPSDNPTLSASPSSQPSIQPTTSTSPSSEPSLNPTISTSPSSQPSEQPTLSTSPSTLPSLAPSVSAMPTDSPSSEPSSVPSKHPSAGPSFFPTTVPSLSPSDEPSLAPSSVKIVTTTIVLGTDQRSTNLVAVGGAYVFVLAGVGYYLFKREKKARNGDDGDDSSDSNTQVGDIEGGILGIAPPPIVENTTTPSKSVSRRMLNPLKSLSVRSLSPFKGIPSFRGKKLEAGCSLSISSGDSEAIPAIQESCSIDSSEIEDNKTGSVDSLDALMESPSPPEEQVTRKEEEKIPASSRPNNTVAKPPRDSLDALMEQFNQQNDDVVHIEPMKPASSLNQIGSASKAPQLVYEEQLINSRKNADFSFRDIFFDPENELYECRVPSGRLGIVVDETGIGPRVQKVNVMSKLYKKISVGDIIIAVDEVDLVGAKPDTFWQLVSRKANKQERCIVVLKI